jgi:hypothetical protein
MPAKVVAEGCIWNCPSGWGRPTAIVVAVLSDSCGVRRTTVRDCQTLCVFFKRASHEAVGRASPLRMTKRIQRVCRTVHVSGRVEWWCLVYPRNDDSNFM